MTLAIGEAIPRALDPSRFYAAPGVRLFVEHVPVETVRWEFFLGRLLAPRQTREEQTFAAWRLVYADGDVEPVPLLTVRVGEETGRTHLVRHIESYVWEPYESAPGVIESREATAWVEEWVGSLPGLAADVSLGAAAAWEAELRELIASGVYGTSRLPIASVETPLPQFSLGRLAYACQDSSPPLPRKPVGEPARDAMAVVQSALDNTGAGEDAGAARWLETALRADECDLQRLAEFLVRPGVDAAVPLRAVFQQVSLTPHTEFSRRFVQLIERIGGSPEFGTGAAADLLGYMLRHLIRHLTAFDLVRFHNFGANYPDALVLDEALEALLRIAEREPALFLDGANPVAARLRRRAVRQALVVRRQYEGHRVPDAPSSSGENLRVLPAPFARLPEEQFSPTGRRTRKLFADQPTATLVTAELRPIVGAAFADLADPRELRELGTALFLDRPLGVFKASGEADRTPLLSYVAASRSAARRRLDAAVREGWLTPDEQAAAVERLTALPLVGVPAGAYASPPRPGVVCLEDAGQAAADFCFLRSTQSSLRELWKLTGLADQIEALLPAGEVHLVIRPPGQPPRPDRLLAVYDRQLRVRAYVTCDDPPRYTERGGRELPDGVRLEPAD